MVHQLNIKYAKPLAEKQGRVYYLIYNWQSVLVLLDEGHVGVVLLVLCVGEVDPGEKTIEEQTERVLVHIERPPLRLLSDLLVVLNVIEIDPLHPVAEVVLVDVGVPRQTERNGESLGLLQAKVLQV